MKTVILCGGYGTRIRDVSDLPKPMIPIGSLPILWHIMKYYSCFGHKDFVLCLGYKSEVIKDFFFHYRQRVGDSTLYLDGSRSAIYHGPFAEADWSVTFAETGANTMTGGRLRRIARYIDDDVFMMTYGDGVADIDIDDLLAFHASHGKVATVTGVRPPARFGELAISATGRATAFNEKPQAEGGHINGGFFVFTKKIFSYLDDRDDLVFETDPVKRLVEDGELMVYKHEGFWQPMDTYREFKLLNGLYADGHAPWVKW